MSLYNMLHGVHLIAMELVATLGFKNLSDIPRFRDCYLFQDEVRLLTRTGGGNRPDYEEQNESLRQMPDFIRDWDDGFDSTFAWWAYRWPESGRTAYQSLLDAIKENRPDLLPDNLEQLTNDAVARIGK